MKKKVSKKKEEGFIALTSILIIGALILVLGVSLFHSALTDYSVSNAYQSGQQAAFLADFCLKEGIIRLEENPDYLGNEEIEINGLTCSIAPVETINEKTKKISALGKVGEPASFSRASGKIHYIIESTADDWEKGEFDDKEKFTVGDFLTLKRPEVADIIRITPSEDWPWGSWQDADKVKVENGDLVLDIEAELKANGEPCTVGNECQSNFCVDGYCCNSACGGACDKCNVDGSLGICTDVNSECAGTETSCYCNGGSCQACPVCKSCSNYSCSINRTTNWGAGTYGCGTPGDDKRCYNGFCYDCSDTGGFYYSDGCNCVPFRSSDGKVCWRQSPSCGQSCDTVCASYGGCSATNWNDNSSCSVCRYFRPGKPCMSTNESKAPYVNFWDYGSGCYYRSGTGQNCAATAYCYAWDFQDDYRFCVCQY